VCATYLQPPTDDADQVYDPAHGRDDATIETFERNNGGRFAASELNVALETRARMHALCGHPIYGTDQLFAGTYYLPGLDANGAGRTPAGP
jgi:hypothetical protein